MEDSGISNTSSEVLRLSSAPTSPMSSEPVVKMPHGDNNQMQDSGICGDLLNRLTLGSSSEDPKHLNSSLEQPIREFYEPDEDGDVQLHLVVVAGWFLLSNTYVLFQYSYNKFSYLGLADVFEALVRMAPSPQLLSLQNNQGYTPLHLAVLQNQPAFVRRLVVAGAKLNLRDSEGNSPLHLSARRGYVECAEALLKPLSVHETIGNGSNVLVANRDEIADEESIIDQRNYQGEHCVHLAAMGGHIAFLQFLSWNGADLNALEGRGGRSALHLAVGAKNLPLVQCLAEPKPASGLAINTDLVDWYGRTAYHLSLLNKQQEIALYLASRTPSASSTDFSDMWLEESSNPEENAEEEFIAAHLVNSSA